MPEATNYLCEAQFARCAVTASKHAAPDMKIQLSAINLSLKDFVRRRNNTILHNINL